MRRRTCLVGALASAVSLAVAAPLALATSLPQRTFMGSVSPNGTPADVNGQPDIFLRDGATAPVLVSASSQGAQADGASAEPDISGDGRRVVFTSSASNLVPGDTNGQLDVFVRDVATGTTERVSVG